MNPDESLTPEPTDPSSDNAVNPAAATPDRTSVEEPLTPASPSTANATTVDATTVDATTASASTADAAIANSASMPHPEPASKNDIAKNDVAVLEQRITELKQQEQSLKRDISNLQASYNRMMRDQTNEAQMLVGRLIKEGLSELEQRKQKLQIAVEQLERRQERIRAEMRTSFAGVSQDLAIRVQGFKDYLVGSLQDLVIAAEELPLAPPTAPTPAPTPTAPAEIAEVTSTPRFADQAFQDQNKRIRKLLDQYRAMPDYYGPPWKLRRTFEPIHAERVANWFFTQGGRGALRTMGSRLQNILISAAVISILYDLYGDRLRTLVLADSPERLGEWRRGLQDCLGVSRGDFGAEQGIVLFEAPEPLAQRADRLVKRGQMPLIIVDESEDVISLSLLQFPLWLAFAPDPMNPATMI